MLRFVLLLAAALLATGSLAAAQTTFRAIQPAARPIRAIPAPDPIVILQSRLVRLEHRVNALESTIDKTQPALSFKCVGNAASQNSVGVSEDCEPFTCAPIDGRCRTTAKTSDDCASGYSWIEGGGCITGQ